MHGRLICRAPLSRCDTSRRNTARRITEHAARVSEDPLVGLDSHEGLDPRKPAILNHLLPKSLQNRLDQFRRVGRCIQRPSGTTQPDMSMPRCVSSPVGACAFEDAREHGAVSQPPCLLVHQTLAAIITHGRHVPRAHGPFHINHARHLQEPLNLWFLPGLRTSRMLVQEVPPGLDLPFVSPTGHPKMQASSLELVFEALLQVSQLVEPLPCRKRITRRRPSEEIWFLILLDPLQICLMLGLAQVPVLAVSALSAQVHSKASLEACCGGLRRKPWRAVDLRNITCCPNHEQIVLFTDVQVDILWRAALCRCCTSRALPRPPSSTRL